MAINSQIGVNCIATYSPLKDVRSNLSTIIIMHDCKYAGEHFAFIFFLFN